MKIKPTKKMNLDEEEQAIQSDLDGGKYRAVTGRAWTASKRRIEAAARAAVAARRKDARTNIRLNPEDLDGIRKAADDRGMGYQTLIASLVHMYLRGELVEVSEVRKMINAGLLKDKSA